MKLFLTTASVIGLCAVQASAQGLTYADANFDYTTYNGDGGIELNSTDFDGEIEYQLDSLYGNLFARSSNIDGEFGPDGVTVTEFGAAAGYFVLPEVLVGIGGQSISIDTGGGDESLSGYDVFAQYDNGQYAGAINYSVLEADGNEVDFLRFFGEAEVMPGVGVDFMYETSDELYDGEGVYAIGGTYGAGPINVRGYLLSFTDADAESFYGLNASYAFGSGLSAGAGYEASTDSDFDYSSLFIEAGYEFMPGVSVSGHAGRISLGETEVDTLGLSLSYEMGEQTRVDRRAEARVRDDLSKGYLGLLPDFGIGLIGFGI